MPGGQPDMQALPADTQPSLAPQPAMPQSDQQQQPAPQPSAPPEGMQQ
jgi:hypothetical protein